MRRVERGRVAPTQAFKAPHCRGVILLELPPTSKWLRPSTPLCSNSSYQPRIVSSSNKKPSATCSQLIPLSNSTRALARLVTRPAAKPSRASAISALRSSSIRKPPRIMRPSESDPPPNARHFSRVLIESGYTIDDSSYSDFSSCATLINFRPIDDRPFRHSACPVASPISNTEQNQVNSYGARRGDRARRELISLREEARQRR